MFPLIGIIIGAMALSTVAVGLGFLQVSLIFSKTCFLVRSVQGSALAGCGRCRSRSLEADQLYKTHRSVRCASVSLCSTGPRAPRTADKPAHNKPTLCLTRATAMHPCEILLCHSVDGPIFECRRSCLFEKVSVLLPVMTALICSYAGLGRKRLQQWRFVSYSACTGRVYHCLQFQV